MHRVLLDQPTREKLKQRSYEQAKKFSWDNSARQVLEIYEEVCGKPANTRSAESRVPEKAVNS